MTLAKIFKSASRAAIVALALGSASLTAMPAQAQSGPTFNFELGIGNDGGGTSFRHGHKPKPMKWCMNNNQVVRGLRHQGFRDVRVVRNLGKNRVQVVAEWGRRDYAMKVDKCTGRVYDVQRQRQGWRPGAPGFHFQFNF